MAYRLLNLPNWLEEYGVRFELVDGWKERGRRGGQPYSEAPRAVGIHHTAGGDNVSANINWQYHQSPDRPIGNGTLFRDGTYRLGCSGISNTQGKGGPVWTPRGAIPLNSGNGLFVSHEATNDGKGQRWTDAQIDAYPKLCAATIACLNADFPDLPPLTVGQIFAHFEWTNPAAPYGPSRKPDPSGPSRWANGATEKWAMDAFRGDVASVLAAHDKPAPPDPPPIGDDMKFVGLFQLVDDQGATRSPYVAVLADATGLPVGKLVKRSAGLGHFRQWLRDRGMSDEIIKLTDETHFRALGPVLHPEAADVWFDGDAVKRA